MLNVSTLAMLMAIAQPQWQDNYTRATDKAIAEHKDLVIYFREEGELDQVFEDAGVKKQLESFVCLKLPIDFKVGDQRLVDTYALEDMQGKPGLAVISYHHKKLATFATAISVHPVTPSRYHWVPSYGVEQVKITLGLPANGTLSQRSMIYAVSVHPEVPQSVFCTCHAAFLDHAQQHSMVQARARRQHHCNLSAASSTLRSRVERGFSGTQEVVAQSWGSFVGGENVLEASFSCIDAWRHSPAHWGGVAGRHTFFGYDIARGSNGTWYATGIFGQ